MKINEKNSGIFSLLDFEHGWEESVTRGADPESLFLYLLDRLVALFLVPWSEDYWPYLRIYKAKPMHLRVVRKRNNWSAAILIAPCSPFSSFSWPQANFFLCVSESALRLDCCCFNPTHRIRRCTDWKRGSRPTLLIFQLGKLRLRAVMWGPKPYEWS